MNISRQARAFYFYPRSPCGERLAYPDMIICTNVISIHALLAESDKVPLAESTAESISIHALLAESDITTATHTTTASKFLSTLSLRRATIHFVHLRKNINNFYPRSPCGERPLYRVFTFQQYNFYPRSPCGERREKNQVALQYSRFLSTLSLRRATGAPVDRMPSSSISIHALLAESDLLILPSRFTRLAFLSTLSLRRATSQCRTLASGT